ncbi:MAG: patatin-like phospholipase family protein [Rhodospirillaceae bacterium]|nr:MAG: patatin-like phospholipase family protein [Rhodospirillaceae bacterium]
MKASGADKVRAPHNVNPAVKRINLALQGGGAHGAFTWGVLDRLLEDERIEFDGISATSAGAMNAVVMTYGYQQGERRGAQKALANFWRRIAHIGSMMPFQPTWLDRLTGERSLDNSPAFLWLDFASRIFSPYQLNPFNWNPLREVLEASVDFAALQNQVLPINLFLSATNVRSGKVKVFCGNEITADAVLASSCLPFLFQAVEIEGEHYWDGGYMGNPAIFPLIYHCDSRDVVIIHINPMHRQDLPVTSSEILNRINEISFNSSLMREMRAIGFVTRLIDEKKVGDGELKRLNIHSISAELETSQLSVHSKLNPDLRFLLELKSAGRSRAEAWLERHFDALGETSTVDITATYL